MLTALFVLVLATGVLVLTLLVVVVVGIRREPPAAELGRRAPNLISAIVRRMLGVSVRRAGPPVDDADARDTCLTAHGTRDEGR